MTLREIASARLASQQIAATRHQKPAEVVAALVAMQAQDYAGALWSTGLRLPGSTEAEVEQALAQRKMIRTWPMRGTLHFVAAADARWLLELLTPRIIAASAGRCRELELDAAVFSRSRKIFTRALQGNRQLTRPEMMKLLTDAGVSTDGQRGYHILWRLAQEGLLCFGARADRQHTFALLNEWLPETQSLDREAALVELARRYFTGHGPATVEDFAGWAGLKISDAKAGLADIAAELAQEKVEGQVYWRSRDGATLPKEASAVHLLPGFDEFLLGYKNRDAMLEPRHAQKIHPGKNGLFLPTVVSRGQVVGTWRRTLTKAAVDLAASPFTAFKNVEKQALAVAAERYGQFVGMPVKLTVVK